MKTAVYKESRYFWFSSCFFRIEFFKKNKIMHLQVHWRFFVNNQLENDIKRVFELAGPVNILNSLYL